MHARDIFLRIFLRTIIAISRKEAVDQILKQCHDSLIIDRFKSCFPEIEENVVKTKSKHNEYFLLKTHPLYNPSQ